MERAGEPRISWFCPCGHVELRLRPFVHRALLESVAFGHAVGGLPVCDWCGQAVAPLPSSAEAVSRG